MTFEDRLEQERREFQQIIEDAALYVSQHPEMHADIAVWEYEFSYTKWKKDNGIS